MPKRSRAIFWVSAAPLALIASGQAFAQEAAQQSASSTASPQEVSSQLADIVVTAERRSSSLQRTPIAIQAVDGGALQEANVSKPVDLVKLVPGLSVSRGFGGLNNIYVRGIGAQIINAFGDMAVAQSIDGAYVARGTALSGAFLDVARIEVLKGPQGTLYGRNATGGAINYITNHPDFETSAHVDAQYGNYDAVDLKGVVNLPFNDKIAMRAAVGFIKHDGYIERTGMDDQNTVASRVSLRFEPSSDFSIYIAGDYSRDHGNGVGQVVMNTTATHATAITADPWQGPPLGFYAPANYDGTLQNPGVGCTLMPGANQCVPPNTVTYNPNLYGAGVGGYALNPDTVGRWAPGSFLNNSTWGVSGQFDWRGPGFTFTFIPAYRHTLANWVNPAGGYQTIIRTPADQQSYEARLASDGNGPLKWLVGLYYFRETQDPFERYWNFNQVPGGLITNQGYIRRDYHLADTSYAAFGQVTYSITPELRLTGGLRHTYEKKSISGLFRIGQPAYTDIGGTPFCPVGVAGTTYNLATSECMVPSDDSRSWKATNWKIGVDYDIGPRSMVYANVSTGFHAGGFNDGVNAPAGTFNYKNSYEPESITAYALGTKNRFLDNRLQLNVELFYWSFKKKQNGALSVLYPPVVGFPILNVGNLKEYGADVEATFLATPDDLLTANVSYLHSRFDNYVFTPTSQVTCPAIGMNPILHIPIVDCAGKPVPNAPMWNASLSWQHTFHLPGDSTIVAGVRSNIQSDTDLTIGAPAFAHQKAYQITDLTLTYKAAEDRWSLSAYVNNVTNSQVFNNAQQSFNSGDRTWWGNILPPRTYGVRASVNF
jgi:iron complex outermembrane receptor protein